MANDGKQYGSLVVDSGPIIKLTGVTGLRGKAQNYYTVPAVLQEIRDGKARAHLDQLPFELHTREPSPEAIQAVSDFARKTGDYQSLSVVDVHVLALAYDLGELEEEWWISACRVLFLAVGMDGSVKERMAITAMSKQSPSVATANTTVGSTESHSLWGFSALFALCCFQNERVAKAIWHTSGQRRNTCWELERWRSSTATTRMMVMMIPIPKFRQMAEVKSRKLQLLGQKPIRSASQRPTQQQRRQQLLPRMVQSHGPPW